MYVKKTERTSWRTTICGQDPRGAGRVRCALCAGRGGEPRRARRTQCPHRQVVLGRLCVERPGPRRPAGRGHGDRHRRRQGEPLPGRRQRSQGRHLQRDRADF
ncbi:MAG: hypothetical protein D6790_16045 [Caldilineae bacterium]|nr:MAG: hypothetical protein D6790_16045 [Caldilineae bacterium]